MAWQGGYSGAGRGGPPFEGSGGPVGVGGMGRGGGGAPRVGVGRSAIEALGLGDPTRARKSSVRKTIDYFSSVIRHVEARVAERDHRDRPALNAGTVCARDFQSLSAYPDESAMAFCSKFAHTAMNATRCPINCALWQPNGARLFTGSQVSQITAWSVMPFKFDQIDAHSSAAPIRCMAKTHAEDMLLSADDSGVLVFWNWGLKQERSQLELHKGSPIRDISVAPSDSKVVTASDDTSVKLLDMATMVNERTFKGHGADVKCAQWHPDKALMASGSKDSFVKLWDPKSGKCLATLQGHKGTVNKLKWHALGNQFISGSKDQTIKLWDIRTMREVHTYRAHTKDVTALAFHPQHTNVFCSGAFEGTISYWLIGDDEAVAEVRNAHESAVWDLAWHPLGHMLASVSQDYSTRFWVRNVTGDDMHDKYNAHALSGEERSKAVLDLFEIEKSRPRNLIGNRPPSSYHSALEKTIAEEVIVPTGNTDSSDATQVIPGMGAGASALVRARLEADALAAQLRATNASSNSTGMHPVTPAAPPSSSTSSHSSSSATTSSTSIGSSIPSLVPAMHPDRLMLRERDRERDRPMPPPPTHPSHHAHASERRGGAPYEPRRGDARWDGRGGAPDRRGDGPSAYGQHAPLHGSHSMPQGMQHPLPPSHPHHYPPPPPAGHPSMPYRHGQYPPPS